MVCFTPELLAKEMDYLKRFCAGIVTQTGSWKKTNNRPHMDQASTQKTTKEAFVSVPYPGREWRI